MKPINHAGRDRLSPLGLILLAVTSVGWGLNFPILKHLLTEWPPLSRAAAETERAAADVAAAAAGVDADVGVLAAAAMLREPLGLREIAALIFTLCGVAVALRA